MMRWKYPQNDRTPESGFTMLEVAVSIALFIIIIILTGSIFTISQRSYNTGADESELYQNIRVALDRMSREIRQSQNIITEIPPADSDPGNPAPSEIFFQDGHDTSQTTYIRYYLDGASLMRAHEAYYFPSDPSAYVLWNSLDQFNNTTTKLILDAGDNVIGEYFQDIRYWGTKKLLYITMELKKGLKSADVTTGVFSRNY